MPVLLITTGTLHPDGAPAYEQYAGVVIPLLHAAGARILRRATFREGIVGDSFPGFIAVMEFPHPQAVHAMFASPAYQAAMPFRNRAFSQITTYVCDLVGSDT
jgi:uncharacterized protein (DUF1330 family)